MPPSLWDMVAAHFEPPTRRWATPGHMAVDLDPRTRQTPALELIDAKLRETFETPDGRLLLSMPPQEGKSQRASRRFPLWALTQNPNLRIAIASYEANIARRWGRAIRDDLTQHADQLGNLRVRDDLAAQHEWQLHGYDGGVFTAGVGGAMTGRPVDLLIIDDPIKGREQADSATIRAKTWDWWTDTALTRLAPGAPVVVIATRWHEDDLTGRLNAQGGWELLNIPAQADHRPEDGEQDVLGREPGQFMDSARGRTQRQWEARKAASGPKTWASLYQGRPSPDEGGILPTDWATYDRPFHTVRDDGAHLVPGMDRPNQELIISGDLAFRDTSSSDYVVLQVWLRIGQTCYLLDMVRRRMNFNTTLDALRGLVAKWPQAHAKLIEARANGDAVINMLQREIPGLIPVEPTASKTARASAISPFAFSGNVVLPVARLLPNVEELREEARNFPNSAHDDTIDALSQAIDQLLLKPIEGAQLGQVVEPDEFEDYTVSTWW
ncbi:phage terminase large subunit [Nesterenkonia sp. K-15-9-6]|uniref:phage terminase large subunit n=1 Tax=Nesterenkonia sp. K-15-9-6 TaxID=3093918 RepID=UPI004044F859